MLHATAPTYTEMMRRLENVRKSGNLPFSMTVVTKTVLQSLAKQLLDRQVTSADVVWKWRDVGEHVIRMGFVTFGQWVEIDKGFELYIQAIYAEYPAFADEVIAQKDMDVRGGENIDTGWKS